MQAVTKALSDVPGIAVCSIELGSAQITATDGITVARAVAARRGRVPARADEMPTSSTAEYRPALRAAGVPHPHCPRRNGCCG